MYFAVSPSAYTTRSPSTPTVATARLTVLFLTVLTPSIFATGLEHGDSYRQISEAENQT